MEGSDAQWDVSGLFGPNATGGGALAPATDDNDAPRRDQEDYYLAVSPLFLFVIFPDCQ